MAKFVPLPATAANIPSDGLHAIPFQLLVGFGHVLSVHDRPSFEEKTTLPVLESFPIIANVDISGAHEIAVIKSDPPCGNDALYPVQFIPSVERINSGSAFVHPTNSASDGLQEMLLNCGVPVTVLEVQLIASGEVSTNGVILETATIIPSDGLHAKPRDWKAGEFRVVHVKPSGEVIKFTFTPHAFAPATNRFTVGIHETRFHVAAVDADLNVQFIPSGEVITRLVPDDPTATKRPRVELQQMPSQNGEPEVGVVLCVHVAPSGEVIITLELEFCCMATNNESESAHTTSIHAIPPGVCAVQFTTPSHGLAF